MDYNLKQQELEIKKKEQERKDKEIEEAKLKKERDKELLSIKMEFSSYLEEKYPEYSINDLCYSVMKKKEIVGYSYTEAVEILKYCIKTYEDNHECKFSYFEKYGIFFDQD